MGFREWAHSCLRPNLLVKLGKQSTSNCCARGGQEAACMLLAMAGPTGALHCANCMVTVKPLPVAGATRASQNHCFSFLTSPCGLICVLIILSESLFCFPAHLHAPCFSWPISCLIQLFVFLLCVTRRPLRIICVFTCVCTCLSICVY